MDVRVLDTLPAPIRSASAIVETIKSQGSITNAYPPGTKVIQVTGIYFILGGRRSIESLLRSAPEGMFMANGISARMLRHNTFKKHFTLIAVYPAMYADTFANYKEWTLLTNERNSTSLRFSDIISRMWGAEAQIVEGISQFATGR